MKTNLLLSLSVSERARLPEVRFAADRGTRPTDQCDCACADASFLPASPDMHTIRQDIAYHSNPAVRILPFIEDWSLAFQPVARYIPILLNRPARELCEYLETPRSLANCLCAFPDWNQKIIRDTLLQLTGSDLVCFDGNTLERFPPPARILSAWLHITSNCNLRCSYCYIDQNSATMLLETGQRTIDAVFRSARRHNYSGVKLKYAGGEPTLDLSLVFQLHDCAARLAEQSNLSLDEVVLSNGTLLTTQTIERMKENHIRLMISVDGIGEHHDTQRKFASGEGSFALVARNIDLALDRGLIPEISVTISDRNLAGLPEMIQFVLERDLPFNLNFYRENDCSMALPDLRFGEQPIVDAMRKAYQVIEENLPRRSLLGSLIDRASFIAPHSHTCGVGHDYIVIDQNGHIAKCQMQITKTVADISADDPLQIVRDDQTGIQNKSVDEKEGCRECVWRYWCAGGCPLATYRATGRYDVKSANCNIYKALYPEVLRLEGLRLLKHASPMDLASAKIRERMV